MKIEKNDEVFGEIELTWEERHIAVFKEVYENLKKSLEHEGWKCFSVMEILLNHSLFITALEQINCNLYLVFVSYSAPARKAGSIYWRRSWP